MRTRARRGVSLATRGGSRGGALGGVAPPALALLDIPSIRRLHVRFNGLRAKPLCGGCFWRDGYWDTGVCGRQLDHEDARCSSDPSALNWRPAIERERTLETPGDAQQEVFVGDGANQLKTDRQALRREAAGNGNGWK